MLRSRLLAVPMLAAVLTACSLGVQTHSAVLPEILGDVNVAVEPVDVLDHVGIVRGVRPLDTDVARHVQQGVTVDGTTMRVGWTGGACESRVSLSLRFDGALYRVRVVSQPSLGGMLGCPAIGIGRAVDIDLAVALRQAQVKTIID